MQVPLMLIKHLKPVFYIWLLNVMNHWEVYLSLWLGFLLTQQERGLLSVLYKAIKKMLPGTAAE